MKYSSALIFLVESLGTVVTTSMFNRSGDRGIFCCSRQQPIPIPRGWRKKSLVPSFWASFHVLCVINAPNTTTPTAPRTPYFTQGLSSLFDWSFRE